MEETMENISENTSTEQTPEDIIVSKIQGQFNEEKWTRMTAKDVSISRFKILDDIYAEAKEAGKLNHLINLSQTQLSEYPETVSAPYFIGMHGLSVNSPEEIVHLKNLLDSFQDHAKWAVVDYLSEKMLKVTENRTILRARATALEKLGKTKETTEIYEKLARLDKKNPDIALRYADAIAGEDPQKAVQFYKQAAEAFVKSHKYDKLKTVWTKLIQFSPEDFNFYRKIERILSGYRQKELISELYTQLAQHFIKSGDNEQIIQLSRKILEYNPNFTKYRNELIKAYREKYKEHSLLERFLELSGLVAPKKGSDHSDPDAFKKSLITAIQNFETNIVFDSRNYVFHRSWGVGKVREITNEKFVVDFSNKESHTMDIQLALKSLKPLKEDHFWVYKYERMDELKSLLQEDIVSFFKILIQSFGNSISVNDIKSEIAGTFIPAGDWTKWWAKTRQIILKDSMLHVSSRKKDVIELQETPVSSAERETEKFQNAIGFDDKLDVLLTALKDPENNEEAIEYMLPYFSDSLKALEVEVAVQALLAQRKAGELLSQDEEDTSDNATVAEIKQKVQKLPVGRLIEIFRSFKSQELKKEFIVWIQEIYSEWAAVFSELLLDTPIKHHKVMLSSLVEAGKAEHIHELVNKVRRDAKDNLEVFLWIVKNLISGGLEGKDLLNENLLMTFFRQLKTIQKKELKGNKFKNAAADILFGNTSEDLLESIASLTPDSTRKIAGLLKDVHFLPVDSVNKFIAALIKINPDAFEQEETTGEDVRKENVLDLIRGSDKILTSVDGLDKKKKDLEYILSVEMPANSEEIGLAQEKGDLRENAEYKAAMEHQAILQAQVVRLETEIKNSVILTGDMIDENTVLPGTKVRLKDTTAGDVFVYTIMDQWDADVDKGIISFRSPLGQSLLNHKVGETAVFQSGGKQEMKLEILSIRKAVNKSGSLV